jgi:hypothetical protein
VGIVLKIISAVYLVLHWAIFIGVIQMVEPSTASTSRLESQLLFGAVAIALSIPAIALYGFGQMVGDFRAVRSHLEAVQK